MKTKPQYIKKKAYLIYLLYFFIFISPKLSAQYQLLDSLTLDTLRSFKSIGEAIKNPESVIKLELRRKKIKKFPPEIFNFPNLQYLDISKNDIEEIPAEIGQLKNLQYLAISRNGLEELPPEIGSLSNLFYLEINNNNLSSLPSEIGKLEKLKTLDLWSNDIDKFPTEIKNLKKLELLDLRVIMIPDIEQARVKSLLPKTKIFFSPFCKCAQ